jgi:DNA invertase Pin-like site-specific DNA recombinase
MKQRSTLPAKRAVLYLRTRIVGSDNRLTDAALERQRLACEQVAKRNGIHIVHEYAVVGGARDSYVRYIVSLMLDAVTRDHVDYVITTGIDRLCRGPAEADRKLLATIRRSGASLLCSSTWDIPGRGRLIDDVVTGVHTSGLRQRATRRSA